MRDGGIQRRRANSNRGRNDSKESIWYFAVGIIFKMTKVCSRTGGTTWFDEIEDLNRNRAYILRAVVAHGARVKRNNVMFLGFIIEAYKYASIIGKAKGRTGGTCGVQNII